MYALPRKKLWPGRLNGIRGPRFETEGQQRYLQTLEINGEVCPIKLVIDKYPSPFGLKFSVAFVYQVEVVRVDYGNTVWHVNHHPLPEGVAFGMISGSHIHSWTLNRSLFSSKNFPDALCWAVPIPQNLKGFPNTFRWVCGEHNVECGKEVPDLPNELLI